jgi:hypothetical protein
MVDRVAVSQRLGLHLTERENTMISHRAVTVAVVALAALAGCSSDNPTAPPGPKSQIAARSVITQSAPVNTAVGAPPSVLVRDGSGTPVAGMTVTFAVTSGGGTVLPATPVLTDASGIATVGSWTLGATPGANTLSATATGSGITGNPVLFAATGLGFTIAARSVITQSAPLNTAVGAPPSVLVRDGSGTPVAGMTVTFAVTGGGGTVLPVMPVVTDANGIATAESWTLGATQGANTLSATATGSDIAGNPVLFAASGLAFTQQGLKLIGTGAVGAASQGYSVSLSADGNTAMVGGFGDNGDVGAVWVWTRSGGVWTQQGSKLVGTGAVGAANQGYAVSLSADGNTAIVGGVLDNDAAGAAWIWTRSGGVWTQQGSKLVGTGAVGNAYQGLVVSLSADGNTAIVGGFGDNGDAGAAWVWTRSGNVWTQQGSKLVDTGAPLAAQGISVSLSADGNTAIVGGSSDNGSAGAAWVWTRSGGVWNQQGPKLVGTGAVGNAGQGYSVSLSADGNTAMVGGDADNGGAGAVWVWTRSGGVWTQQGSKLVGTDAVGSAGQGIFVSLSADGNAAMVAGSEDNATAGAVWFWIRSGGVWTQQGSKLVGTGAVGVANQGISVSLSADGNTAMVGGWLDNVNAGAAWVFTRP